MPGSVERSGQTLQTWFGQKKGSKTAKVRDWKLNMSLLLAVLVLTTACATTDRPNDQAVRDFIVVGELEEQDSIRTRDQDSWQLINDRFLIYEARRQDYLVEFRRPCYDLREGRVVPDRRWAGNEIRARFDTLNGCLMYKIYQLGEGQALELKELGDSPGDLN